MYAKGLLINGIIVVDTDKEFDDNPLFYVNSEYPVYKNVHAGFLQYSFEYYTDNKGNKYLIHSGILTYQALIELINKADWSMARNVDAFVEGADKDNYKRWLELIS